MTVCIEEEMCLMKNILREQGIPTHGLITHEFRKKTFEDERKLFLAREKAKKRVSELSRIFPNAFGAYKKRQYENEFIQRLTGKTCI